MEEVSEISEERSSERPDIQRYLNVVRRRHVHFLIPLLLGWLVVWGASWVLPARYKSGTLILVEQPTMPKKPTSPNRPKIFALVLGFALMTGSGLVVASEALNPAIRRSADLLKLIDGHLVVAIPNISTQGEIARKKRRTLLYVIGLAVVVLLGLVAIYFVLPPLDILFDKIMAALFR